MPKRRTEPEEGFGPAVNGLEDFPSLDIIKSEMEPLPEFEENFEEESVEENIETPRLLLCGSGEVARESAQLAQQCGFRLEIAIHDNSEEIEMKWPATDQVYIVPDWLDIVERCNIDRNCFVCLFIDNLEECEDILLQCLPSDARYLGVYGDMEKRHELFRALRELGAPDAELVAIACPMGLNIGAISPIQQAVAICAELLAAKAGTLKRLGHSDYKKNRS